MKNLFKIIFILAGTIVFLLHFQCIIIPGSGTETIGGILVDSLGNPVVGANVTVTSLYDTSITFQETTGSKGEYRIHPIKAGQYSLFGATSDTILVTYIDSFEYENDNIELDMGQILMAEPGSISGMVYVDGTPVEDVEVFLIPTVSYTAHSNDSGYYSITNIPRDTYDVHFKYVSPNMVVYKGVYRNVPVFTNQNTEVPLQNLLPDTTGVPPPPDSLWGTYDTTTGCVTLSWNPVHVSDLKRYKVYKNNSDTPIGYTENNSFIDTVFKDPDDTNSYECSYQIKSEDNNNQESFLFSPIFSITAHSPTLVKTYFSWIGKPDSIDVHEPIRLIIKYANKCRKNTRIWWTISSDTVRTKNINDSVGFDTLMYTFKDSGNLIFCIKTLDNAGCMWSHSETFTIHGSYIPDTWDTTLPGMKYNRKFAGAAVIDSKIFTIGGIRSILGSEYLPLPKVESYTIKDSSWNEESALTFPRGVHAVAVYSNSALYAFGGLGRTSDSVNTIEKYSLSGTWTIEGTMPTHRFGHTASAVKDRIYIIGGFVNSDSVTACIDSYDPQTGTWESRCLMNSTRYCHQAVVVDDYIYIIGGLDNNDNISSTIEIYDPQANAIIDTLSMPCPRFNFGAAVIDTVIHIMGGLAENRAAGIIRHDAYNITTKKWFTRKELPKKLHSFATCVVKKRIFLIGGQQGDKQVGTVLRYNP